MGDWLGHALTIDRSLALVLAVSTVLLWFETRRLAELQKSQRDELKRSVEAAELTARAALKSADLAEKALIGVERPILRADLLQWGPQLPVRSEAKSETHKYSMRFKLENYGKIPAILRQCVAEIRAVERPASEVMRIPVPDLDELDASVMAYDLLEGSFVLPPGHALTPTYETFIDISEEHLRAFWGLGLRRLIFLCVIDYEDAIGIRRHTGFTYFYSPLGGKSGEWTLVDNQDHFFDRIVSTSEGDAARRMEADAAG